MPRAIAGDDFASLKARAITDRLCRQFPACPSRVSAKRVDEFELEMAFDATTLWPSTCRIICSILPDGYRHRREWSRRR